jgi:hypothetical protein
VQTTVTQARPGRSATALPQRQARRVASGPFARCAAGCLRIGDLFRVPEWADKFVFDINPHELLGLAHRAKSHSERSRTPRQLIVSVKLLRPVRAGHVRRVCAAGGESFHRP